MLNYNNSSIYKLCCKDANIKDIYIGSTTNFTRRKCCHKSACNNINTQKYNCKVYKFIRDNGNWDNWDMVLIENVNVNNKNELHKKEREWIEKLIPSLNSNIPTRTKKEYTEMNKETKKIYYEKNKETKKEYQKIYNEKNKENIKGYKKIYYEHNKEYQKEYRAKKKKEKLELEKLIK